MSLRDWFAGQAMVAAVMAFNWLRPINEERSFRELTTWSYRWADAMLEEREK